jgi:hypothetical protein
MTSDFEGQAVAGHAPHLVTSPRGRVTYVYLMSHGFSGSTLTTFLLGAHPEIATVGEMGIAPKAGFHPDEYVCSCQEFLRNCPFWQRVSEAMRERGQDFDMRRGGLLFDPDSHDLADRLLASALRPPLLEQARRLAIQMASSPRTKLREVIARNEAFADVVCGLKGCHTFVDASKRPERAVRLLEARSFDLRVLHLVRDPRAVANSCVKNLGYTIEDGARSVAAMHAYCMRARDYFPSEAWLTVRYEDLCADVQGVLGRIFEFAGVSPATIGNFRAADHHVIGNRMRLDRTSQITVDEKWKSVLTAADVAAVNALAGKAIRECGYPD